MSLNRRVPTRPLAIYRIVLGVVALLRCGEAARILSALYDPTTYRVPWVSWMPALEWSAVVAVLCVWAVGAAAFTVGAFARTAGTVTALAMFVVLLLDAQTYSNHLYLLTLLLPLVAWAGGGKAVSVDAKRGRGADSVPAWPVMLAQTQITAVYLFGALSKATPGYVIDTIKYSLPRALLEALPHTAFVWVVVTSAVCVVASELFIAVGLWVPRYRPAAIGLAALLHLGMIALLGDERLQITFFAAIMLGSFPLWLRAEPGERVVLWDDTCSACRGWVRAFRALDWFDALSFRGTSAPTVLAEHGVSREEADHAMYLVTPDARSSGFGAVAGILAVLPAFYLAAPFLRLPGISHLGDAVYRRHAARRHCALSVTRPSEQTA